MFRRMAVIVLAAAVAACASSGTPPRPRPFPGAELPPVTAPPEARPSPDLAGAPDAAPLVIAVLATAMELRGTPYSYGGSDPSGFDCSGFVQWVFAQHGTLLPREVRDQFDAGELIDRDEVRPGDLVFFQTVSRGASHVGIAIGNDEFIHAPSSRGVVRIEKYASGYWDQRWVGARRVG